MPSAIRRRSPEELLQQIQAEEDYERRGRLKVFLGYASGVGKSFRMLDEGRRRSERGQDIVVGAIQPKTSPEIQALLNKLEVIPLREVDGVYVMDTPAILKRHPSVCLVDGLAYDNPPGAEHASRWEDVNELLDAGISVLTSINIQYIDDLRERVQRITGKTVTQTVPRSFLNSADEIVVVDAPPEMCIAKDGPAAVGSSGPEQKLSELREIALLLAADVVDKQLEAYLHRNGIPQTFGAQERILVCITPRANAAPMISSGKRNADRFHGDLTVAYVRQAEISASDQEALERNLAIARAAQARIEILDGQDPIETLLKYAHEHGVTQIFVGHSTREQWWERFTGTPLDRLIRGANDIDVRVFPH
jgi:two-component system, OmpR family, sensor histidine kinase KdpD